MSINLYLSCKLLQGIRLVSVSATAALPACLVVNARRPPWGAGIGGAAILPACAVRRCTLALLGRWRQQHDHSSALRRRATRAPALLGRWCWCGAAVLWPSHRALRPLAFLGPWRRQRGHSAGLR